jgi:hypothetical protein
LYINGQQEIRNIEVVRHEAEFVSKLMKTMIEKKVCLSSGTNRQDGRMLDARCQT